MPVNLPIFTENDYDFQRNLITFYDLILVPVYWVILSKLAFLFTHPTTDAEKLQVKVGLWLKFIGSVFANMIYSFYYAGGDSNGYFNDGKLLNRIFLADPQLGKTILLNPGGPDAWQGKALAVVENLRNPYSSTAWVISKFAALFELFCFRSVLVTGMLFAFFSFLCFWKFYQKILELYPGLKHYAFAAVFLIPGVVLWGSGIFKDTVCISCIFLLFVYTHELLFKRQKVLLSLTILVVTGYVLYSVRSYILISFSLSMLPWLFYTAIRTIKSRNLRISILVIFTAGTVFITSSVFKKINTGDTTSSVFDVNEVLQNSARTGSYIKRISEDSEAFYDIGEIEPTLSGFIRLAPAAVNVTLFRPYLWEAKNILVLVAAFESLLFLCITLFMLIKVNPFKIILGLVSDPFILSCICFCLIFSVFVGISSFNFGALSRYKITCLPFYLLSIFILLEKNGKLPFFKSLSK